MNGLTTYQDSSRKGTLKGKKMTKPKAKVTKAKPRKRQGKKRATAVAMPTMPSTAEMQKMMGGK